MACEAGCCGSCVFTKRPGDGWNGGAYFCKIWDKDPIVKETYESLCCAKYQLNPAALED